MIVLARIVGSELLSNTVKSNCKLFSQNVSETNMYLAKDKVAAALNFESHHSRYYVTIYLIIAFKRF